MPGKKDNGEGPEWQWKGPFAFSGETGKPSGWNEKQCSDTSKHDAHDWGGINYCEGRK